MRHVAIALAVALASVSVPAAAQWRLVDPGESREVANSNLVVTAPAEWNRSTERQTRRTEIWTKDGNTLNELDFWLGLKPGEALFRERSKKRDPLPRFDPEMLPTDLVEFFEDTARKVLGGSLVEAHEVRPATLAGHPAVEFDWSYTGADEIERLGLVRAAIVGGRLYIINFDAPRLHYFDEHVDEARAIMDSARFER